MAEIQTVFKRKPVYDENPYFLDLMTGTTYEVTPGQDVSIFYTVIYFTHFYFNCFNIVWILIVSYWTLIELLSPN